MSELENLGNDIYSLPKRVEITAEDISISIFRNLNSYNVSRKRATPKNNNLDYVLIQNHKTGESLVIRDVQTVANYPDTKPDGSEHPDSFKDTIAATSLSLIYKSTTNITGDENCLVISDTRTIDGRPVSDGYTVDGITPGRGLFHSSMKPDKSGDYNNPYSEQCFIPKRSSDFNNMMNTLDSWGLKDNSTLKANIYVMKPWEVGE